MAEVYNHHAIEKKWQKYWEENQTFKTDVWDFSKPKYYALDMFPYPSGVGLHAGHPEGYTATDIMSRMKRMQGYNVLHPMGYDSFGLPAEQYAVTTGNHPAGFTEKNIQTFSKQLKELVFDVLLLPFLLLRIEFFIKLFGKLFRCFFIMFRHQALVCFILIV